MEKAKKKKNKEPDTMRTIKRVRVISAGNMVHPEHSGCLECIARNVSGSRLYRTPLDAFPVRLLFSLRRNLFVTLVHHHFLIEKNTEKGYHPLLTTDVFVKFFSLLSRGSAVRMRFLCTMRRIVRDVITIFTGEYDRCRCQWQ